MRVTYRRDFSRCWRGEKMKMKKKKGRKMVCVVTAFATPVTSSHTNQM